MCATDQPEADRRHQRVELIQHTIALTPSQGLVGIGLKLALAVFLDGFVDDQEGDLARSAYLDTVSLLGRDFLAEAEDIVERAREREAALAETGIFATELSSQPAP
jgi:hypothetical protein